VRRLNKDNEYSLTCRLWPCAYATYCWLLWWQMQRKPHRSGGVCSYETEDDGDDSEIDCYERYIHVRM